MIFLEALRLHRMCRCCQTQTAGGWGAEGLGLPESSFLLNHHHHPFTGPTPGSHT